MNIVTIIIIHENNHDNRNSMVIIIYLIKNGSLHSLERKYIQSYIQQKAPLAH